MDKRVRFLLLPLLLCCSLSSKALDSRFDLIGPRIDVQVTRDGLTLPIAAVPNLQAGDKLYLLQRQVNIQAGFQLNTQQGGSTWPLVQDQNGAILNQSTAPSGRAIGGQSGGGQSGDMIHIPPHSSSIAVSVEV